MKKSNQHFFKLLFILGFINFSNLYAQTPGINTNLSVGGKLETVFDRFGKKYKLADIKKPTLLDNTANKATLLSCSSTSIFNLYFEPGSGMESTTDPIQIARRAVVCKVFKDISNFLNTPLTTTGNKVNIWVRNINNINSSPTGVLGLATSFYNVPYNTATSGVEDSEVWKTITLGVDSYSNVTAPLGTGISVTSGIFYHGMVAFNFNTTGSVNWHTNLTTLPAANSYDLYSIVLREVTHTLGFTSLIDQNGNSIFGTGFKYYSRYDRFLKNNITNQFLLTNTGACNPMYNYNFNAAVPLTVLRPNCTLPNNISNGNLDNTNCLNAIKYVGNTNIVPVYTPTCFENGNSLSHFEDQCMFPFVNNAYFVMSNTNNSSTVKRYLKPEERNTLCDIGYSVKTSFGSSSTLNGYFNYGGTVCTGITVAGIHDGLNANGTYTFIGDQNTNIPINGTIILNNDRSGNGKPTAFVCLEDVTNTPIPLLASGTNTTIYNFNSPVEGLHLLRYVPKNGAILGNITYIYVYVKATTNCATPTSCNIVNNGDFEQNYNLNNNGFNRPLACGWNDVGGGSYDLYQIGSPSVYYSIPCNIIGVQGCNNSNGNSYIGMANHSTANVYKFQESIVTKLKTPLLPNASYQLSFDVSLSEGESRFANKLQAYLSNSYTPMVYSNDIIITNPSMLFTNPSFSTNYNGWDTITFTINTTTGGEQYLYLGALSNLQVAQNTVAPLNTTCTIYHNNIMGESIQPTYYFIDNVKLITTGGGTFNLPINTDCVSLVIPNLTLYLSGLPTNGVFTGTGVTFSNGVYSFNSVVAGVGNHTINYTYTNNLGCLITLKKNITVTVVPTIPTFNFATTICTGGTAPILPSTSSNNINGTWSPAIVSNTATADYTFTPTAGQCASEKVVTITVNNCPPITTCAGQTSAYFDSMCFKTTTQTATTGLLETASDYCHTLPNGILVNGVSATASTVTFSAPSTMPAGISINPNGTLTIAGNTPPGNYNFDVMVCQTGTSNCLILNATFSLRKPIIAQDDVFGMSMSGAIISYYSGVPCSVPGTPGCEANGSVLYNDALCDGTPATMGSVGIFNVLPQQANSNLTINSSTGLVQRTNVLNSLMPGTYTIKYRVRALSNLTFFEEKTATIIIQNVARMAKPNTIKAENEFDLETVEIAPNPSTGNFTLSFNSIVNNANIKIYNMLGQSVYDENIANKNSHDLSLNHLQAGSYILKLSSNGETVNKKIIIR